MVDHSTRVVTYVVTDPRLGRHLVHDDRSRGFAMELAPLPTRTVLHARRIPIFDQGQVGCCTAAAGLGMLGTGPLWRGSDPAWSLGDVHALYAEETRLDDREIPGHWPPTDTGSAGLYLCKALRARRLIGSYWHAFSLRALLAKLAVQPCAIGIPWLNSMFEPQPGGRIAVDQRSGVAGGHEVCVDGVDPATKTVRIANSWGGSWGDHGWGWLSWDDLGWLLSQGGDAVTVTR